MHTPLPLLKTPHPREKYEITSVWSIGRFPIITHKLKIRCSDSTYSLTKYSTPSTRKNMTLHLSCLLLDYYYYSQIKKIGVQIVHIPFPLLSTPSHPGEKNTRLRVSGLFLDYLLLVTN